MNTYENEQKRLQKLLGEVGCDETHIPYDDESDESDHEETEIHESEQDIFEPEKGNIII